MLLDIIHKYMVKTKVMNVDKLLSSYAAGKREFSQLRLWEANLREVCLPDVNLAQADLSGGNLSASDLRGANLSEANLTNATLWGANLSSAVLIQVNLSHANLIRAMLSQANLHEAILIRADLRLADLRDADLSGADLTGADLRYADLSGTNLAGANLNRANLTGTILSKASSNANPEVAIAATVRELGQVFFLCRCLLYRYNPSNQIVPIEYESVADGEGVTQVLTKLLDNACKFTDSSGKVTIHTQIMNSESVFDSDESINPQKTRLLKVIINDTGRGIESSQLDAIFDRFHQEEGFLQRTIGGTGLGLAICRQIVQRLGGEIWARSAGKNQGSQFHFTVPLA
jgi:signal transduction histidine kinase